MHPLIFEKSAHNMLWGAECWELSAFPTDPSRIAMDSLFPNFPLLFKVIDAKTRLSVQVHPNEETCNVTGGDPKTEMWCALSDGPIYAGLKAGTTAAVRIADKYLELQGTDGTWPLSCWLKDGKPVETNRLVPVQIGASRARLCAYGRSEVPRGGGPRLRVRGEGAARDLELGGAVRGRDPDRAVPEPHEAQRLRHGILPDAAVSVGCEADRPGAGAAALLRRPVRLLGASLLRRRERSARQARALGRRVVAMRTARPVQIRPDF